VDIKRALRQVTSWQKWLPGSATLILGENRFWVHDEPLPGPTKERSSRTHVQKIDDSDEGAADIQPHRAGGKDA